MTSVFILDRPLSHPNAEREIQSEQTCVRSLYHRLATCRCLLVSTTVDAR
jgi:hypothetical protein